MAWYLTKSKNKQTNKQRKISAYMKIEFQNSVVKLSFFVLYNRHQKCLNESLDLLSLIFLSMFKLNLFIGVFLLVSSSNRLSQPNWLWHNICLKISHYFSECVITTNWRWTSSKDVNIHVVNGSLWVVHWCDHSPTKESSVDSSVD